LVVTISYGVWAWQGVEFPISPLTCVVALTTLSNYTVRACDTSRPAQHSAHDQNRNT